MEDLSPLRSGSRKKKVRNLPSLAAEIDTAFRTLHVYVSETLSRRPLALLQCLQRSFPVTFTGTFTPLLRTIWSCGLHFSRSTP